MSETFQNKNLVSNIERLRPEASIALALWCMDRSLDIFAAVTLRSNFQSTQIPFFIERANRLWYAPDNHDAYETSNFCARFNIEAVIIEEVNESILKRLFFGYESVTLDQAVNAILDSVAIVSAASRLRNHSAGNECLGSILESYYDIYYQPTFDLLTEENEITQEVFSRAMELLERTDPLMSALRLLEAQVSFLSSLESIDFADLCLRGTCHKGREE